MTVRKMSLIGKEEQASFDISCFMHKTGKSTDIINRNVM